MDRQKIVFSTRNYDKLNELMFNLRDEMYANSIDGGPKGYLNSELFDKVIEGVVEVEQFSDTENYQRIATKVVDKDVFIIGGTPSDMDFMELYDLACAAVQNGAYTLTIFIPYFGYSKESRKGEYGEVQKMKNRARILSGIPKTNKNTIYLFDPHVEVLENYFENDIIAKPISMKKIIKDSISQIGGKDFILASIDASSINKVKSLSSEMGVESMFLLEGGFEKKDLKNKTVVIYYNTMKSADHLIESGKTLKESGAKHVHAVVSHAVVPENALNKALSSGFIDHITTTDTHPMAYLSYDSDLAYEVRTIASIILEKIES